MVEIHDGTRKGRTAMATTIEHNVTAVALSVLVMMLAKMLRKTTFGRNVCVRICVQLKANNRMITVESNGSIILLMADICCCRGQVMLLVVGCV